MIKTAKVEPETELFPVCAVTWAMGHPTVETVHKEKDDVKAVVIPVPLESIAHSDLVQEQYSDPSLNALFELVSPVSDIETAAQGYFVQGDVLVRKWCAHGDDLVGKPVVQGVVPAKFRETVMKASHDDVAGHMGVQKTYRHTFCVIFFGPD